MANGYITQLGLFHDNMFNQFNLGSDLMEPFRILVDKKVNGLQPDKFEDDEKEERYQYFNSNGKYVKSRGCNRWKTKLFE